MPPHNWRVKYDLKGMSKQDARAGFQQAFSTPFNPKFAQRVMLGTDPESFTPLTDDSFTVRALLHCMTIWTCHFSYIACLWIRLMG